MKNNNSNEGQKRRSLATKGSTIGSKSIAVGNTGAYDKLDAMKRALSSSRSATSLYDVTEFRASNYSLPYTKVKLSGTPGFDTTPFTNGRVNTLRTIKPSNYAVMPTDGAAVANAVSLTVPIAPVYRPTTKFGTGVSAEQYTDEDDAFVAKIAACNVSECDAVSIAIANMAIDAKSAILARSDSTNPFYTQRVSAIYDAMLSTVLGTSECAAYLQAMLQIYQLEPLLKLGARNLYNSACLSSIFSTDKDTISYAIVQAIGELSGKLTIPAITLEMVNALVPTLPYVPSMSGNIKVLAPLYAANHVSIATWPGYYLTGFPAEATDVAQEIVTACANIRQFLSSATVRTVNAALAPFTLMSTIDDLRPFDPTNTTTLPSMLNAAGFACLAGGTTISSGPLIQFSPVYPVTPTKAGGIGIIDEGHIASTTVGNIYFAKKGTHIKVLKISKAGETVKTSVSDYPGMGFDPDHSITATVSSVQPPLAHYQDVLAYAGKPAIVATSKSRNFILTAEMGSSSPTPTDKQVITWQEYHAVMGSTLRDGDISFSTGGLLTPVIVVTNEPMFVTYGNETTVSTMLLSLAYMSGNGNAPSSVYPVTSTTGLQALAMARRHAAAFGLHGYCEFGTALMSGERECDLDAWCGYGYVPGACYQLINADAMREAVLNVSNGKYYTHNSRA